MTDLANIMTNSWTADVRFNNGQVDTIWYTCWPSVKHIVKEVLSISSDLPKVKVQNILKIDSK